MLERSNDATRQYIDSVSAFTALEEATHDASKVRGGMYWHKAGIAGKPDYLVRTSASEGKKSLGIRSHETEAIFEKFHSSKKLVQDRVEGLKQANLTNTRLNRALTVIQRPS